MLDYEFLCIISLPIYIFFLIFLIFKKIKIKDIILFTLFYFYIISLIAITIFPIPIKGLNEISIYNGKNNNFIPLKSIFDILLNTNLDIFIKMKQIIGNIVIFIPIGFLLPFILKGNKIFKKAFIIAIFGTFFIELSQYLISFLLGFNYRVTDIDDILLNISGFIIGYFLYKLFQIIFNKISGKINLN